MKREDVKREEWLGRSIVSCIAPLLVSLGVSVSCYAVSGVSLGLFFGPVLLLTFVTPPLALRGTTRLDCFLTCVALALGTAVFWLAIAHLSVLNLLRCGVVLFSYVMGLAGAASLLMRLRIGPVFASAAVVWVGILWLTWPVWLCPWLDGPHAESIVGGLTVAHPLMAMNSVLFERFNFWDRYTITYQHLTSLNQDIYYSLPKTILWMVLSHLAVGAGILSFARRADIAGQPANALVEI